MSDCCAKTPKILSKKTYISATEIPNAKFTPVPPLLFSDETEKPIKVKINIEKGTLHFLYLTTKYLSILVDPLLFSVLINFDSSL